MNDQMLGADPEQLRALAKLFDKYSSQFDSTSQNLQPSIMNSRWRGADADRFRQRWSVRLRPDIASASRLFNETAKKLNAQAKEQEDASSASSLGGGGGYGGGGGGSWGDDSTNGGEYTREFWGNLVICPRPDVEAWWESLTPEEREELLTGKDEDGIPNAYHLAELGDKLPADVQEAARDILAENAAGSIPMYAETDKYGIDGQLAWAHGGAHISSNITQNADGSATLKVSGDIGGGVNTPSTKAGANVTLTGELSKTYTFNSLEEARAARAQMLNELPPDSFGKAKDAVSNPGEYLLDTLDKAASDNGSEKNYTSAKGTASVGITGKLSDDVKGGAKLDLAYERNLSDGTSSASATGKVNANLDLGEGMKFGGSGEAGVKLSMDADGDVQKVTITAKGTVDWSTRVQDNPNGPKNPFESILTPKTPDEGLSAKAAGGVQATAKFELPYTANNQALIDSYMSNMVSGDTRGAGADLQKIYDAAGVTFQVNANASSETNLVDFDSGVVSLKIGGTNDVTSNLGTIHKTPFDGDYDVVRGEERYTPKN